MFRSLLVRRMALPSLLVLAACGPDKVTSPLYDLSPDAIAARAVALNLSATAESATRIKLTWSDTERGESGWQVFESTSGANGTFVLAVELAPNSTTTSLTGRSPVTQYCYKVRAFTTRGKNRTYAAFSNVACATTPQQPPPPPPAAPSAFDARPLDAPHCCQHIALTWTDNSLDDNGFIIEQAGAPEGPWAFVEQIPPRTNWTILNVPEEQQLCYRVIARRDTVRSQPSNADCTAFPRAPSEMSAVSASGGVDLSWLDNSSFEHGFVVERQASASTNPPPPNAYTVIATLPPDARTYHDATVVPDTKYWYRVWALRDGARSGQTNMAVVLIAATPPVAPANLEATPWSSHSVSVGAEHESSNASGFRLERSADGVAGWVSVGIHWQPGISDGDLPSEQRVCYRMFALNSAGESPPSNVDCTTPPAAPSGLTFTPLEDGTSRITWRDNSNVEDAYVITLSRLNCDWDYPCFEEWFSVVVDANTTVYIAAAGETLVAVNAVKDGGYSDWNPFVP